jgi:hypothetical protein
MYLQEFVPVAPKRNRDKQMSTDIISALVGLLLTIIIFSYLIGDNPLFRIAVYLFVGVASGYAATAIWYYVIVPKLFQPLTTSDPNQLLLSVVPLVFSASLLTKLSPRISWIGNFAMAVLVGVGAAAAIGGALFGTLAPQYQAAIDAFDLSAAGGANPILRLVEATVMFFGTVLTLASFHFSAGRAADGTPKRNSIIEGIAWAGRIFIAITLGVLFAGVYMAALTALIERLSFVVNFIRQLIGI